MASGDITVKTLISGTVVSGKSIRTTSESITFTSITDVVDRTLTLTSATEVTALLISTNPTGDTLAALNCISFHNTSATITVEVGFIEAGAQSAYFKLAPDETMIMMSATMICDDDSGAVSATFANIDKVTLHPLAGTAVVEMVAF